MFLSGLTGRVSGERSDSVAATGQAVASLADPPRAIRMPRETTNQWTKPRGDSTLSKKARPIAETPSRNLASPGLQPVPKLNDTAMRP